MNVLLLAPILVHGEMSGFMCRSIARTEKDSESYHIVLSKVMLAWMAKNEQVSHCEPDVKEREHHVTWLAPNAWFIFVPDIFKMRAHFGYLTKTKEPSLSYHSPTAGGKQPFSWTRKETQTILSGFWTRVVKYYSTLHHHRVALSARISWPSLATPPYCLFRLVLRATSRIGTELLYVDSSWSSCFCSSMRRGSTGVHHLWARPYFSSSVPHVWFV